MTKKKDRETRLWQVDPSVFQPGPKAGFVEREILDRTRSLAKYALFLLGFAYPAILVSLGLLYGGLVFWVSLAGSMGILWVVLRQSGYARNFESWDIGYKQFLGLVGGLALALVFYLGLLYMRTWPSEASSLMVQEFAQFQMWIFPIAAVLLVLVLLAFRRKTSE